MALAFRAAGTQTSANSGNIASAALPAGHVLNDILVATIGAFDNVVSTNATWTLKTALNNGTGAREEIWWLRDNGSVSAPTFTRTSGKESSCCITAYSGVDPTLADPFRDIQTTSGSGASGNAAFNVTGPALTGVVSGDLRVFNGVFTVAADTSGTTGARWAPPASFTERRDGGNTALTNAVLMGIDDFLATGTAGSITSSANWDGGAAPTPVWVGCQFALSSATSTPASADPKSFAAIPFQAQGRNL